MSVLNKCRISLERLFKTANSFREFFFPIKSKSELFFETSFPHLKTKLTHLHDSRKRCYRVLSMSAFVICFWSVGGEVVYFKLKIYMKTPLCLFYSE